MIQELKMSSSNGLSLLESRAVLFRVGEDDLEKSAEGSAVNFIRLLSLDYEYSNWILVKSCLGSRLRDHEWRICLV